MAKYQQLDIGSDVRLWTCALCSAIVTYEGQRKHDAWHARLVNKLGGV